MDAFQHWLDCGMNERYPDREFTPTQLAECFIRLNRGISTIKLSWGDSQLASGLWYLYGSGSCYLSNISHLDQDGIVTEFFRSVPALYSDLFADRCTTFFSHLDSGPEPANPLNGPCYMLWDMDGGIDSFWHSGRREYVELSVRLLEDLSALTHPAIIESVVHGLGHMVDNYRGKCQPILERIMDRAQLPQELKDYAANAIHHYIQ